MNLRQYRSTEEITPSYKTPRQPLFRPLPEKPKCGSSDMFIWDAIEVAGKALLTNEWDGTEMSALDWPISPDAGHEVAERLTQAKMDTLRKNQRGAPPPKAAEKPYAEHVRAYASHFIAQTKASFEEAKAAEQALWEQNAERVGRLERTCDWLAENFREGVILTRYRFCGIPGALHDEEPGQWNVEGTFRDRFLPGSYERWFISPPPPKKLPVYIFVDRATLANAIDRTSAPPSVEIVDQTIKVAELSDYLRLALHVHAQGFGPTFSGLKKVIVNALVDAAPRFGLCLTRNDAEALATFLRNPDAKGGKNKGR